MCRAARSFRSYEKTRKYAKILRVPLAFEGASWYNQLVKKMRIYADLFRGANYGAGEKRVSSKAD